MSTTSKQQQPDSQQGGTTSPSGEVLRISPQQFHFTGTSLPLPAKQGTLFRHQELTLDSIEAENIDNFWLGSSHSTEQGSVFFLAPYSLLLLRITSTFSFPFSPFLSAIPQYPLFYSRHILSTTSFTGHAGFSKEGRGVVVVEKRGRKK